MFIKNESLVSFDIPDVRRTQQKKGCNEFLSQASYHLAHRVGRFSRRIEERACNAAY
jgi:hypothetical protein